ncbi:MAG: hypothetical protein ACI89U_000664, partial [Gammaproteobacteria bacterium]
KKLVEFGFLPKAKTAVLVSVVLISFGFFRPVACIRPIYLNLELGAGNEFTSTSKHLLLCLSDSMELDSNNLSLIFYTSIATIWLWIRNSFIISIVDFIEVLSAIVFMSGTNGL